MVILKKLYSNPSGLFDTVVFNEGINVIYGRYSDKAGKRDSLNSVGKTSLVNLINFCLLSSFDSRSKLYGAGSITSGYLIALDLEIENETYTIQRSTETPRKAYFGVTGGLLDSYKIEELKVILCNKFFGDQSYPGMFSDKWFRKLISFFMRDEKVGYDKDPIIYMPEMSKLESVQHNLFLLGIDNCLAFYNYRLKTELKEKSKTIKEVKSLICNNYNIEDIEDVNATISKQQREIEQLEKNVQIYRLDQNYKTVEEEANDLTSKIKQLVFSNFADETKITKYQESYEIGYTISPKKISRLYEEIDSALGLKVKVILEDAVEFKKQLIESRKRFLTSEIKKLETDIQERRKLIEVLDTRRADIFQFLENKEAIKDLTEAFENLNTIREQQQELKGKLQLYNDLKASILDLRQEEAILNKKINEFMMSIKLEVEKIRVIFDEFYNAIYHSQDDAVFNISYKDGQSDSKIEIKAQTPDSGGWGKGRGCILVYDLTVLFNAILTKRRFPSFLIHDGIFNGIDKSHFVSTMNLLEKYSHTHKFQYIFTANEDDTWVPDEKDKEYGQLSFDLKEKLIAVYNEQETGKLFKRKFTTNRGS